MNRQDRRGGEIVWEWHTIDHLIQDYDQTKANFGIVADHPERIDANYQPGPANSDWFHINGLDYNEEFDQIVVSVPTFDEIWVIDHSTTTEQASGSTGGRYGKGGDILYRWGNPLAYGVGARGDQRLFFQHNPTWVPTGFPGAGNILIYNNGQGRPDGNYSSVVEITPPANGDGSYNLSTGNAYEPSAATWEYIAPNPEDFYSSNISGAQRLSNGNTLVCEGSSGHFFEVNAAGDLVWEYVNPVTSQGILEQGQTPGTGQNGNTVFRTQRYAPDYPGFTGRDLPPGDFIEQYPSSVHSGSDNAALTATLVVHPNPVREKALVHFVLSESEQVTISTVGSAGRVLSRSVRNEHLSSGEHQIEIDFSGVSSGTYFVRLDTGSRSTQTPVVVRK